MSQLFLQDFTLSGISYLLYTDCMAYTAWPTLYHLGVRGHISPYLRKVPDAGIARGMLGLWASLGCMRGCAREMIPLLAKIV